MTLADYADSDPVRAGKMDDRRWRLENGMFMTESFGGGAVSVTDPANRWMR